MRVIIKNNQWLGDLAIVYTGSIESLMQLAKLNDISITDELISGNEIELTEVLQQSIKKEFEISEIFPATGLREEQNDVEPDGIGYMVINVDFIVS